MYSIEIINNGGSQFDVKSKDYEFVIDTEGKGITPPDTLLASIGSCMGVYIRKYFKNTNVIVKDFKIEVRGELSIERPISFKKIDISIDLHGVEIDEMRRKSLIEFVRNCPVHNTLRSNPVIETIIK